MKKVVVVRIVSMILCVSVGGINCYAQALGVAKLNPAQFAQLHAKRMKVRQIKQRECVERLNFITKYIQCLFE